MKAKVLLVVAVLTFLGICADALPAGSITGQGRFQKIAGNPAAGYQTLYEWDLFLSPPDNGFIGPCRRLGAPPGQMPTGDGYYRIDTLPAGNYSVLINQPDFFASPKVVPNVQITDGQLRTLNVDLDVDYSTYFSGGQQWTEWGPWDWYQTFLAAGASVRGVSWKMAGWGLYDGKTARIRIVEDNGDSNVRNWRQVGYGTDNNLNADSDEWVRWTSGEVPLVPGKKYAVNIHIDGGLAIYKRDKDSQSYLHGKAYDQDGAAKNFDLNITVFVDKNNQTVTHTKHFPKLRGLQPGHYATRWGQSFVATGTSLASVDVFAAGEDVPGVDVFHLTWTIHKDGPGGPRVGPAKRTYGAYFAAATDLIGVSYNPGDVPLTLGQTYYVEFTNPSGFTPFTQEPWDRYADGQAWKNGAAVDEDLAMTIIEYNHPIYRPVGFAAYYNLDEGLGMTAHDSSGRGHTGYVKNADPGVWVPGRFNTALNLDGQNDYVTVTDYKGVAGAQPRTCAAWIKTAAPGRVIIAWGTTGVPGARWTVCTDDAGRLRVEIGGAAAVGTRGLTDDQWHHVAVVSHGATPENVKFYVDGRPEAPTSGAPTQINTVSAADVVLGAAPDFTRCFQGILDDVAVFDVALTEAQVRQLCTTSGEGFLNPCGDATLDEVFRRPADLNKDCIINLTDASILAADWLRGGLLAGDIRRDDRVDFADAALLADDYLLSITPGLMVHLQFDESSGLVASDSSVNGYAGAMVNMADNAWVAGRSDNALAFDGVDDSVVITGYKGIGGGNSRTVCAWIKTADAGGVIASWGMPGRGGARWLLLTEAGGHLRVEVGGGVNVGGTDVCDGQWRHVAVVLDNDGSPNVEDVKLYVDGRRDAPTSAPYRAIDTVIDDPASPDVVVGFYAPSATFFRGLIDDLRIYSRALTAEEMASLAQ